MADAATRARLQAELKRDRDTRASGYRARALAMYPHVCARCGRDLSGRRISELDVHHKDHNHSNNPPDGSNWELLCLYCHDHEHEKYKLAGHRAGAIAEDRSMAPSIFQQFANLDALIQPKDSAHPTETSESKPGEPRLPDPS